MSEAYGLIGEIESLARTIESKKLRLAGIQANCRHTFTQPEYDPIIVRGYVIAPTTPKNYDDIPYCQGSVVPDRVTKRWTRKCTTCFKVEVTSQADVQTHVTETPKFR